MPSNPFITRAEWQKEKEKYAIPDKVVSYSFGAKLDSFHKEFDNGKMTNLTTRNVGEAQDLASRGKAAFSEYSKALAKLKPEAFKHKTLKGDECKSKALARLQMLAGFVDGLDRAAMGVKDPFVGARKNYDTCVKMLAHAIKNPQDSAALQNLYSQGMRNHLGAPFHAALNTFKGEKAVLDLLHEYEQLLAKWHSQMQGEGPSALAKDLKEVKAFLVDMQQAMHVGVDILKKTKPA